MCSCQQQDESGATPRVKGKTPSGGEGYWLLFSCESDGSPAWRANYVRAIECSLLLKSVFAFQAARMWTNPKSFSSRRFQSAWIAAQRALRSRRASRGYFVKVQRSLLPKFALCMQEP